MGSALLVIFFDISVFVASNLIISFFIFVSYLSFMYLIKKITGNLLLALIIPIAFFSMPIVIGKSDYGALMIGFTLLPFYFAIFVYYQSSNTFISKLLLTLMFIFALFMDGYSFVFILFMSIITSSLSAIQQRNKATVLKLLFLFTSIIIAVLLYRAYVPSTGNAFLPMPLDFFRGQGVDLITLLVPQEKVYWITTLLSYGANWNPLQFNTDGEMVYHSFLGYGVILSFIILGIALWKKRININKSLLFTLALISLGSLLLAMGPSLKFNDINLKPDKKITFQSYLMQEEEATLTMPYADLFIKTPAINNMRATHRWLIVFKFSILIILSIFLSQLIKVYKHRAITFLVYFLVILIIAEQIPNFQRKISLQKVYKNSYNFVDNEIVNKLKKYIPENSIVAFYSNENDYMSNYICSSMNIKCLNTGGDKNIAIAEKYWPKKFNNIRKNKDNLHSVHALLKCSSVDFVVLPKFNMRWDSYGDNISSVDTDAYDIQYASFLNNEKYIITESKYFIILKNMEQKQ